MSFRAGLVLICLVVSSCATAPGTRTTPQSAAVSVLDMPFGDPGRRDRQAPLVLDAVTDTTTSALLTPTELAQRLRPIRLVFVGESHTHLDSHLAQARLIDALAADGRRVLVGLEMFPRDAVTDEVLRAWTEGRIDEEAFLRQSRWYEHWGYPFGYYRDVFTTARSRRARLFGVNAPRKVIAAVRSKNFGGLAPEEQQHLPARVDTTSEEHRRLFRAFFGGADATHGPAMPTDAWEGMFRAQCAWDAVMASNALAALERETAVDAIAVVLLGSGHVAFGLGAPRQAAAAGASAIASVITVPALDDDGRTPRVRASYADFIWTIPPEPELPAFPTLGVSLKEAEQPEQRKGQENDKEHERHPKVVRVSPDSPADKAGVKPNDVLVAIDDTPVPDQETVSRLMGSKQWADGIRLTVRRTGTTLVLKAVLRRVSPHRSSMK